jgi:hypothetical protein
MEVATSASDMEPEITQIISDATEPVSMNTATVEPGTTGSETPFSSVSSSSSSGLIGGVVGGIIIIALLMAVVAVVLVMLLVHRNRKYSLKDGLNNVVYESAYIEQSLPYPF